MREKRAENTGSWGKEEKEVSKQDTNVRNEDEMRMAVNWN